ncbi:MAG: efflux RND transporter periplasmic adaptor subunit [Bacteroidales bacterium]|nr:efflux RND transporter periplasmic adaptor subunit [Bacteroidales bacterium]
MTNKTIPFLKSRNLLKKLPVLGLTCCLVFTLNSCKEKTESKRNFSGNLQAIGYIAQGQTFTSEIIVPGKILAMEELYVTAPLSGLVTEINFKEGQHVQQSEKLIQIDDRHFQSQLKALKSQLLTAENDLKRKSQLVDVEGVSTEAIDLAKAKVLQLEAQMEELEVKIDLASIQAPFSGKIGMRDISVGTWLNTGQAISTLVQDDRLKIQFEIPGAYAAKASVGQKIRFIATTSSDSAEAEIYAINSSIDATSGSIQLRAKIDNKEKKFVVGDFVQVVYNLQTSNDALLVPADAIVPQLNGQIIYIVKSGKVQSKPVTTGGRTKSMVQILSGLSAGDTVIISNLMKIKDKAPITINQIRTEAQL